MGGKPYRLCGGLGALEAQQGPHRSRETWLMRLVAGRSGRVEVL
jgi:hypothetical protein